MPQTTTFFDNSVLAPEVILSNLGIGTTTPGAKVQVAGGLAVTTSTAASSDPGAGNLRVDGNIKAATFTGTTRRITAAGSVTIATTDRLVVIRKTTGEPTSVVLPAGSASLIGQPFLIKDGKGDAATNNITITVSGGGNIEGASSFVISNNRQSLTLEWDGTEYVAV